MPYHKGGIARMVNKNDLIVGYWDTKNSHKRTKTHIIKGNISLCNYSNDYECLMVSNTIHIALVECLKCRGKVEKLINEAFEEIY